MDKSGKSKLHAKIIWIKNYFAIFLAIGLLVASCALWKGLSLEEEKHNKNLMALEAGTFKILFAQYLNQSIFSLERLKNRWENKLYLEKKQWLSDTQNYVNHKEELSAIEWVDKDYIVQWIQPFEGNEAAQNLDLHFEKIRKKSLDLAKKSRKTVVTELIDFVQGGKGFLSASPIFIGGEFNGFILGVFEINKVLRSFTDEMVLQGVDIEYFNLIDPHIKEKIFFDRKSKLWKIRTILPFRHLRIGAIFSFNDKFLLSTKFQYQNIVGASGIILSLVFGMLVYLNKELKLQSDFLIKQGAIKNKITSQLKESEKRIRVITDSVPALISYIDEQHFFQFNSKAYEKWFGLSKNEVTGKHVKEVVGQKAYGLIKNHLETALSGQKVSFEIMMPYKYGGNRYIHSEFVPDTKIYGKVVGVFAMITDITKLKNTEMELKTYRAHLEKLVKERTFELETTHKQLIQSEKLSATGKLAATMTHEINNPICGIRNALEGIYERAKLNHGEKTSARMAIDECNRIANLVKDLNDFHRSSPQINEIIDINSVISNLLLLESKKLKKKCILLEQNFASNLPKVTIINDQFKQVILNLLNNAEDSVDQNKEGGRISITTESKDSKVMIHVSDNGCGISKDTLDHIFEPFVTTKAKVSGVGLGLSISYGIIKSFYGEIEVDSTFGKGSTFSIILPANEKS